MADLFPLALGVALSPLPVGAVVVLLLSARAATVGWGFATGFVVGIVGAAAAAAFLATGLPQRPEGEQGAVAALVEDRRGSPAAGLGTRRVVGRLRRASPTAAPRWLTALDRLTLPQALALGLLLSAANPKNPSLALSAGLTIAAAERAAGPSAAALALFVLVATSTVLEPVLAHRVAPQRVAGPFGSLRRALVRHSRGDRDRRPPGGRRLDRAPGRHPPLRPASRVSPGS